MTDVVRAVTRYHVKITAKVEADVKAALTFTDDDVREWAGIEPGSEPVDPELIEEYADERIGEEGDLDVTDVTRWVSTDVTILRTEKEMRAPAEFVALPGLEGEL